MPSVDQDDFEGKDLNFLKIAGSTVLRIGVLIATYGEYEGSWAHAEKIDASPA
jgi:hypothetical protein